MRRNQKEEDLRENHPYFDRPLFAVPRESKFRKICQTIVNARYDPKLKDSLSGKERKVRFKTLHKLLGLVTYLDWCMIIVTTLSAISMLFETPEYRYIQYSTFLNDNINDKCLTTKLVELHQCPLHQSILLTQMKFSQKEFENWRF